MDDYSNITARQKLVLFALTFVSFSTIFIIGILLDALMYSFILLVAFSVVNVYLMKTDKKIHAPGVLMIPDIVMCYLTTNIMFLICILIMRYTANETSTAQAIALGAILIGFASIILSGIFYWQPKGKSKYQKEIEFVKHNPICPDLTKFEEYLKSDNDNLTYMCYKYIFKDGRSWSETAALLETDTARLTPVVDKLAFGIRLYCKT